MKKIFTISTLLAAVALLLSSCTYRQYAPAEYPESVAYFPAALDGIWVIDSAEKLPVYVGGKPAGHCEVDPDGSRLHIHLGVVQSGITLKDATLQIFSSPNTVNKMIASEELGIDVLPLPGGVFSFPDELQLSSASASVLFDVDVKTSYLKDPSYLGRKFAFALKLESDQITINSKMETLVVLIDPKFLLK